MNVLLGEWNYIQRNMIKIPKYLFVGGKDFIIDLHGHKETKILITSVAKIEATIRKQKLKYLIIYNNTGFKDLLELDLNPEGKNHGTSCKRDNLCIMLPSL